MPGFTKNTRNRKVLEAKCWVLVFVCPVTRLTNLQVIEKSDNLGMIDGDRRDRHNKVHHGRLGLCPTEGGAGSGV